MSKIKCSKCGKEIDTENEMVITRVRDIKQKPYCIMCC